MPDSIDSRRAVRERWLELLAEAERHGLDEVTLFATLGVLTAEWLATLPEDLADQWGELVAAQLEARRSGVS